MTIRFWMGVVGCGTLIAAVPVLTVLMYREWVKEDLRGRVCEPLSVRLLPTFGYLQVSCVFAVTYSDLRGSIHRARCRVYQFPRSIVWEDDRVIGYNPERAA